MCYIIVNYLLIGLLNFIIFNFYRVMLVGFEEADLEDGISIEMGGEKQAVRFMSVIGTESSETREVEPDK